MTALLVVALLASCAALGLARQYRKPEAWL